MRTFSKVIYSCLCLTILCGLSSCRNTNYKKACAEKDWDTAYEIVDDMYKDLKEYEVRFAKAKAGEEYREYEAKVRNQQELYHEALLYVISQEAISVYEEFGEEGKYRIKAIAQEHNVPFYELEYLLSDIGISL
ncbi:MAG: hypothetical protein J1F40_08435 [Prevotellaceae bacterium]|nr:hypothetical protein [Prevotellaceae bacterium]